MSSNGVFSDFLGNLSFTSWDLSWVFKNWLTIIFIIIGNNYGSNSFLCLFNNACCCYWYWYWFLDDLTIIILLWFFNLWFWGWDTWCFWLSCWCFSGSFGGCDGDTGIGDWCSSCLSFFSFLLSNILITSWKSNNSCFSFFLSGFTCFSSCFNCLSKLFYLGFWFGNNLSKGCVNGTTCCCLFIKAWLSNS